ncbi:MAG: hypothetical protein WAU50_13215 [Candidatus Sulfotelmatobacter sp.]
MAAVAISTYYKKDGAYAVEGISRAIIASNQLWQCGPGGHKGLEIASELCFH